MLKYTVRRVTGPDIIEFLWTNILRCLWLKNTLFILGEMANGFQSTHVYVKKNKLKKHQRNKC